MPESDSSDNNILKEIDILRCVFGHVPIGINKNFNMIACLAKLNAKTSTDSSSNEIWRYLASKYNLERLEELHKLPFSNNEIDFDLSENEDFKELIEKQKSETEKISVKESPNKNDLFPEASNDNTSSSASISIHITPQAPVRERKRKSIHSNASDTYVTSSVEKAHVTPGRRRNRSDSEKTEKSETKHTPRFRQDKEKEEHNKSEKLEKNHSTPSHSSTREIPTSKRGRASTGKRLRGSPAVIRETITPKSNKKQDKKRN